MYKNFLVWGTVLGGLSVALGAFGAHALKRFVPEAGLTTFETGVRYQFYHVFALLIAAVLYTTFKSRYTLWAGNLFLLGILLFCGSLYALTFLKAVNKTGYNWIGAITPVGGLAFIAGWFCLLISVLQPGRQ